MKSMVALLLAGQCAALSGCLEREMTITSEPAGALVYVSDVEVGRTPVTIPFTWYGDYDIILRLDGYESLKTHARIDPPVQEIPPWDLLAEMAPWTFTDRRYLHFDLRNLTLADDETLIRRAESMREENLQPVKR